MFLTACLWIYVYGYACVCASVRACVCVCVFACVYIYGCIFCNRVIVFSSGFVSHRQSAQLFPSIHGARCIVGQDRTQGRPMYIYINDKVTSFICSRQPRSSCAHRNDVDWGSVLRYYRRLCVT